MGSSSSKPSRSQRRQSSYAPEPPARKGSSSFGPESSSHRRTRSMGSTALMREEANGAPPAYGVYTGEPAPAPVPKNTGSSENALEFLRQYDTVCLVDDSGSMAGSLWKEAGRALAALSDVAAKYDDDGLDIYFLNDPSEGLNMRTSTAVQDLFSRVRPRGITPLGGRLEYILLKYLAELEQAKDMADRGAPGALKAIKPVNILVITDGCPTDDPESVIVSAARRLDRGNFPSTQVGIQMVQIGNDAGAAAFLQELDDGLGETYGIRDIVDTVPFSGQPLTAEILTKILLGGVNRRVDRRGATSVMI